MLILKIINLVLGDFSVNCYIVYNEESGVCAVIDPGEEFEVLDKALEEKTLVPEAIILTHAHFDHIGAVKQLREKYNSPIYINADETEILADGDKNLSTRFCDEAIEISDPEYLVRDGDCFTVAGLDFEVLHTPGHTKGCTVYKCGDTLFTGDTLFAGTCGRCDVWSSDVSKMRESLERLCTIPESFNVLAGHGPATTLDRERKSYKLFI